MEKVILEKRYYPSNVKNALISRLISSINEEIDCDDHIVVPITNPRPLKYDIPPEEEMLVHCKQNYLPCIQYNCKWLEFQDIFHPKLENKTVLPVIDRDTGECKICKWIRCKKCTFSDIQITRKGNIYLNK